MRGLVGGHPASASTSSASPPRRPRCAAGSRAAPSASTAAARRRTSAERVEPEDLVATRHRPRSVEPVTFVRHYLHARPGLRRPPPLDLLGRHRDGPADRAGGRRAKADVVLLTDHDTLAAKRNGEEGWYGDVLLLVGEEVSPRRRQPLPRLRDRRRDRPPAARRSRHLRRGARRRRLRLRRAPVLGGLRALQARRPGHAVRRRSTADALHGIELWSFVNDTGERGPSIREMAPLPGRAAAASLDHPPARNMRAWDELCRTPPGRRASAASTPTSSASGSGQSCRCG